MLLLLLLRDACCCVCLLFDSRAAWMFWVRRSCGKNMLLQSRNRSLFLVGRSHVKCQANHRTACTYLDKKKCIHTVRTNENWLKKRIYIYIRNEQMNIIGWMWPHIRTNHESSTKRAEQLCCNGGKTAAVAPSYNVQAQRTVVRDVLHRVSLL